MKFWTPLHQVYKVDWRDPFSICLSIFTYFGHFILATIELRQFCSWHQYIQLFCVENSNILQFWFEPFSRFFNSRFGCALDELVMKQQLNPFSAKEFVNPYPATQNPLTLSLPPNSLTLSQTKNSLTLSPSKDSYGWCYCLPEIVSNTETFIFRPLSTWEGTKSRKSSMKSYGIL